MRIVYDPRYATGGDTPAWRKFLKYKLVEIRGSRSDLSGFPTNALEMHEGLFERRWLPKKQQSVLFCEYNCLLLTPQEHIPEPPSRTECYWLLVAYYTKPEIDTWVASLPFKVPPDLAWAGTNGTEVIRGMVHKYVMSFPHRQALLDPFLLARLDCEA